MVSFNLFQVIFCLNLVSKKYQKCKQNQFFSNKEIRISNMSSLSSKKDPFFTKKMPKKSSQKMIWLKSIYSPISFQYVSPKTCIEIEANQISYNHKCPKFWPMLIFRYKMSNWKKIFFNKTTNSMKIGPRVNHFCSCNPSEITEVACML